MSAEPSVLRKVKASFMDSGSTKSRGSSSLVQSHRRFLRKVILGAQEVHAQPLPEIELAAARRAESQVGDSLHG